MKILVLQLKRIGDLILTTPALSALREAQPGAQITLVHATGTGPLIQAMPFVDRSFSYGAPASSLAFWPRLMLESFDACVDFTGNDRSALLSFLSKATRRLAFGWVRKSTFRPLFYNELIDSSVRDHHTIDHYLHLLAPLGVATGQRPIHLEIPEAHEQSACELLRREGIDGPMAIIHPGSARPEKYWDPERWAAVMDFCSEKGLRCVLTGAGQAYEQEQIGRTKAAVKGHEPLDLSGRIDLLTLAALIRKAKLLLSVDSAAMHLGAAFGTPQVALFGMTNPFHWRPRHAAAVVLSAAQKMPVSEFVPKARGAAMKQISTQSVLDAITRFLP